MDILDVGLTINEFKMEWRITYTPNDMKYWAPRLESDIPAEKACAVGMFEAWGKEIVLEHHQKWQELRENRDQIISDHNKKTKRDHEIYSQRRSTGGRCFCYDCEEYLYVSWGTGSTTRRRDRQMDGRYTDYEKCQMDWQGYFDQIVKKEM